jgi:SOS-response transcriptional repressor LexA
MHATLPAEIYREPLTGRQRVVMDYILGVCEAGSAPSIREIQDAIGVRSPNGVVVHLQALERKGYLRRAGGRARMMEPLLDGRGRRLRPAAALADRAAVEPTGTGVLVRVPLRELSPAEARELAEALVRAAGR